MFGLEEQRVFTTLCPHSFLFLLLQTQAPLRGHIQACPPLQGLMPALFSYQNRSPHSSQNDLLKTLSVLITSPLKPLPVVPRECPNPPSWPPSLAVRPEHCSVHSDFPSLARHTSLSPHHRCSLYQEAPLVLTSKPPQSHIPCPALSPISELAPHSTTQPHFQCTFFLLAPALRCLYDQMRMAVPSLDAKPLRTSL